MLRNIVGKNIRAVRRELGMTQEELSLYAEVDKAHVGKIERGKWNPSLGTLQALANELDIKSYDLFRETDGRCSTVDSFIAKSFACYLDKGICDISNLAGLLDSDALFKLTVDDIENGA